MGLEMPRRVDRQLAEQETADARAGMGVAEGDRTPFSFLISYEKMMEIMEQPKYARVAKSFVTEDRTEAVFMLWMIEAKRTKYRVDVVNDLRAVCRKYGFNADLVGGVYYLQGRLQNLSPKVW